MKILFVGDIVGKPGRRALRELMPVVVGRHEIDLTIVNCENAAGGFGITREVVDELLENNVQVLTTGNHVWDKKESEGFIDDYAHLLRPANYPPGVPGRGYTIVADGSGNKVGVINLMGRIFMRPIDCPFRTAEAVVEKIRATAKVIVVDIHAEATSEKQAVGWFLDGKVSAVIGTHTHVQTSDNRVLTKGAAYITDAGMTGPLDSVIGVQKEKVLGSFLTGMAARFDVAKRDVHLQGVILDVDEETGRSRTIERVDMKLGD
ncbi:MAG: TIGR00282 family metallophosphoesterase [Syntrophobacterales bacterium]|nr:TIGR00282 family metallophosphoesterase [Syntrophobacterales bacterium]